MNRDYKFLTGTDKKPVKNFRPQKHHLLAVAAAVLSFSLFLGLAPDNADANRSKTTSALAIEPTIQMQDKAIRQTLDLPPDTPTSITHATVSKKPEHTGNWKSVTVKNGDNMAKIFSRVGLSANELHRVMQLGKDTKKLKRLQPGDKVSFRIEDKKLADLAYKYSDTEKLIVSRMGDAFKAKHIKREFSKQISHASGEITSSLFLAAQKAGLTDNMTMELAGVFGWDIDFALDIRAGDRFTVIYEENYLDGKKIRDGNILAATFTNRSKTFKAIRYTDVKDHAGYYSPEGRSMRKAFLRTPVEFSRISSRFNLRRKHPILNRIRAHTGVDYAAPRGTPVRATGDGRIIHRARKGGYGKTVIIRHGNRYSTLYAHLSNYNRKARRGSKIKQGQIIGYIGSSGLATGPHLHYEFRANGVHRNPLRVKFPKAASINKKYRADFLNKAKPMISQLDMLNRTRVAMQ